MRRFQDFRLAAVLALLAIASGRSAATAESVKVTIDAGKKCAEINPFIYG